MTLAEEHDRQIKLEGIFLPKWREQRDEYRKVYSLDGVPANSLKFVHYTSAEAALSIIKNKRLWMRNALCMSDYREVVHGFEILRNFFKDANKRDVFAKALDKLAPGVLEEALDIFNQHWKNSILGQTYIASVSEHLPAEDRHGRLSMWRAFGGGNVARVGIVLKLQWGSIAAQSALNLLFNPVAYLREDEVHASLLAVIENIRTNADYLGTLSRETILNSVFTMLLAGVTCLKHEGFKEEREWRAIYSPYRASSQLMGSSIQVVGGVPQIVYQIPIDSAVSSELAEADLTQIIDRIIIGPSPYGFPLYDAFRTALVEAGIPLEVARDSVVSSGIPIRV